MVLVLVDLDLLSAIEQTGSLPNRPHSKCARVIGSLDEGLGLAPAYAYLALCDLAKPWIMSPTLVDFHGELGTRDTPSAIMRMTECRLSWAGACALAAERGEIGPVPLGLILGNAHLRGHQPPFDVHGVLAAVRLVLEDPLVPEADVIDAIGAPAFPTDSRLTGDIASLVAGEWAKVTLQARIIVDPATGSMTIEHLPPTCSPARLAQILLGQHWPNPLTDEGELNPSERQIFAFVTSVDDQSSRNGDRLVCTLSAGVTVEETLRHLVAVREITSEVDLKLPLPLASMVRGWVSRWDGEDLATSLDLLETSVDQMGSERLV